MTDLETLQAKLAEAEKERDALKAKTVRFHVHPGEWCQKCRAPLLQLGADGHVYDGPCRCDSIEDLSAAESREKALREALVDANDACRSAYEIASRFADPSTNGVAWVARLRRSLMQQQAALTPTETP